MSSISTETLGIILLLLICLSAFFSGSETAMMSLNRYRLRHLAKNGDPGAARASRLLERPDRLIGIILLGNNFVNILASALATIIAIRLLGEGGIAIASLVLTAVILIFAEVTPKTLAALHPERISFPASYVLTPMLKVFYPVVWVINTIANSLLRLFGVYPESSAMPHVSREELRAVVNEAGTFISRRHQRMLISILDLEQVTVEDIMIPRNEIVGIDLADDLDDIITALTTSQHTRLPLYWETIDYVVGIIHVRNPLHLMAENRFSKEALEKVALEPYFVPEATPLHNQLLNFQKQKRRMGLVVDEYGDIQGLITLEDILEEIVGEFTTDAAAAMREVHPQEDGSYLVDGSANVRMLNRTMHWEFPTSGPKTLNGIIIEYLESIPEPGTTVLINGYPIDIVQTTGNAVKTARVHPALRQIPYGTQVDA